ncbi:MAG: CRTAC1 family protein, partial [Pseudomonadota bacterium]
TREKLYRGSSFADYDNDGDMDMLISNFDGTNTLYRNNLVESGKAPHWLKVKVRGTVSNRDGIGTRLSLTTPDGFHQMREVDGGSGYAGRNTLVAHFGTNEQAEADVLKATFPSGVETELLNVPLNTLHTIVEPTFVASFDGSETRELTAGETATIDITYRNVGPETATEQVWVLRVAPSGVVSLLRNAQDYTLNNGASSSISFQLPTTPATELGRHRIIVRVGRYQGALIQQDHIDLLVGAAQ